MRHAEIERLDDQAAATGHVNVAYQSPTASLRDDGSTLLADPAAGSAAHAIDTAAIDTAVIAAASAGIEQAGAVAWQAAIEQLLQLIGPDTSNAALGTMDSVAPASFVAPPELPDVSPLGEGHPIPLYVIESLPSGQPPLLSLDESDLFGDVGAKSIDLLATGPNEPPPLFKGMDIDLFGPSQHVDPIKIVLDDPPQVAPSVLPPGKEPPVDGSSTGKGTPPDGNGYYSLLDSPTDLHLSSKDAHGLANAEGQLFIDGNGDDHVYLSGDWKLLGDLPDKQATYYTDASGTIDLTVHNADVVLV